MDAHARDKGRRVNRSRGSSARSPFPWFGGKQKLADELIALFPPHSVYVEVFGGGGSVLLNRFGAAA